MVSLLRELQNWELYVFGFLSLTFHKVCNETQKSGTLPLMTSQREILFPPSERQRPEQP